MVRSLAAGARRRARFSFGLLASIGALTAAGCLDRPLGTPTPHTTRTVLESQRNTQVDKLDLLLAIDNSSSMSDKQELLGLAVPRLVDRLVNPLCVDTSIENPIPLGQIDQPDDPSAPCPVVTVDGVEVQTTREFEPVKDIHVGIISSSLGDLNADTCGREHPNDQGHLLDRTKPAQDGDPEGTAPTFEDKGFLLWDPGGKYGPETGIQVFRDTLADMVVGVNQDGCGYEQPLEAIVRFLVDPAPYLTLEQVDTGGSGAKPKKKVGLDKTLLDQRADFLRPDSLVAVILLSDENDCSVQAEGFGYIALSQSGFDAGSAKCAEDETDKCCYSCSATAPPEGCEVDEGCKDREVEYSTSDLRCWEQKRRFGVDSLYPVARYANAFKLKKIDPNRADLVPRNEEDGVDNPLLAGRPPNLVYFAGIVGVPWQAIARQNEAGQPDLTLGYKTPAELESGNLFAALAGDPDKYVKPTDPFMVESVTPRTRMSTLLGAAPSEENGINDRDVETGELLLQATCRFEFSGETAKATPGLRQLSLIQKMGEQGIAASVCPARTDDENATDYGYNPAVGSIVDALKAGLNNQQCLPFELNPNAKNQVDCIVIETRIEDKGECHCDISGHTDVPPDHQTAVDQIKEGKFDENEAIGPDEEVCFCEIAQLEGDALHSCQYDKTVADDVDGWCYLDATPGNEPLGDPALIQCGSTEPRSLRAVGDARQVNATLHMYCTGEADE